MLAIKQHSCQFLFAMLTICIKQTVRIHFAVTTWSTAEIKVICPHATFHNHQNWQTASNEEHESSFWSALVVIASLARTSKGQEQLLCLLFN